MEDFRLSDLMTNSPSQKLDHLRDVQYLYPEINENSAPIGISVYGASNSWLRLRTVGRKYGMLCSFPVGFLLQSVKSTRFTWTASCTSGSLSYISENLMPATLLAKVIYSFINVPFSGRMNSPDWKNSKMPLISSKCRLRKLQRVTAGKETASDFISTVTCNGDSGRP